jgi:hypothetical protein
MLILFAFRRLAPGLLEQAPENLRDLSARLLEVLVGKPGVAAEFQVNAGHRVRLRVFRAHPRNEAREQRVIGQLMECLPMPVRAPTINLIRRLGETGELQQFPPVNRIDEMISFSTMTTASFALWMTIIGSYPHRMAHHAQMC